MKRIAYLLSADVAPGRENRREDAWEVESELSALSQSARRAGLTLFPEVWDEPTDWASYDAAVVRAVWDYTKKSETFLPEMEGIAKETRLLNPVDTLRRNMQKTYLMDLADKGVPCLPTVRADSADATSINAAFEDLDTDEVVVKPVVGACSWRQARIKQGESLPGADDLPLDQCLIQPYMSAVAEEGEVTLIFYNGQLSHGLLKRPKDGDYRTQSLFGATEVSLRPNFSQIEAAQNALEAWGEELLYARVDLVRGPGGQWLVMELELIEPYLYLPFAEDGADAAADRFTKALEARLL